jgi:hypothetical protein
MKHLAFSLLLTAMIGFGLLTSPVEGATEQEGNFQIMKATADKIWRLNKTTGEISVCTLDGERLLCTSSTEAIRPPAVTYEERQAEKKRMDDEKKVKDMEFFDRALSAIRSLFEATLERDSETPK